MLTKMNYGMKKNYMANRILSWIFLILMLFAGTESWGQILTFDFAGLAGNEASANSNSNNSGLTNSSIIRGTGLTASTNADRFNATNWALTSIANAISGNNYMEFTITPTSGNQFSVSTIVVQWQRSGTGNTQISLRSSIDNYSTDIDGTKIVTDNTNTQTFTWTVNQSNSSTPITYRFYSFADFKNFSSQIRPPKASSRKEDPQTFNPSILTISFSGGLDFIANRSFGARRVSRNFCTVYSPSCGE